METFITRETTKDEFIKVRDRFGKCQQEIADESGLSLTTVFRAENGRMCSMKSGTIYKLNLYFTKLAEKEENAKRIRKQALEANEEK